MTNPINRVKGKMNKDILKPSTTPFFKKKKRKRCVWGWGGGGRYKETDILLQEVSTETY